MHNVLKRATMIFCGCLLILMLVTPICQGEPVIFVDDVGKEDESFIGQLFREGEAVAYASLISTKAWRENEEWMRAPTFTM